MLTTLNIADLDNLRAETMMALLNAKGREEIWKYDIVTRRQAAREAIADQNYDNIENARRHADKPFALIGPGIDDCYFGTVAELVSILFWLYHGYFGDRAVKLTDTYQNQQEFLRERPDFPFLPLQQPNDL